MEHFDFPRGKRHKTIVGGEEDAILDGCKGKITRIIDRASQANRDFDRPLHAPWAETVGANRAAQTRINEGLRCA